MPKSASVHIRTKPAADSVFFCGMNKNARFQNMQNVGPKAKGGTCGKCVAKRDAKEASK